MNFSNYLQKIGVVLGVGFHKINFCLSPQQLSRIKMLHLIFEAKRCFLNSFPGLNTYIRHLFPSWMVHTSQSEWPPTSPLIFHHVLETVVQSSFLLSRSHSWSRKWCRWRRSHWYFHFYTCAAHPGNLGDLTYYATKSMHMQSQNQKFIWNFCYRSFFKWLI